jgi:hypothetical protein
MWITRRTLLATLAVPLILAAAGAYTVSAGDENAPIQNQANEGNVEPAHDSPERPQSARPGVVDVADGDPVSSHGPALNPEFRSRLLAGDGNPLRTYTYEAPPNLRDKINTRFEGILESADKDGVKVELTWQWQGDNRLEITAPDAAQQTLVADTEAGSTLPGLKLISTAGYARSNYIDPAVESPRLQAEIRRLHSLINEENKNLANIEVFKQLALRNARSPEEIEKAIDAALNVDGKIVEDQQRIASLQSAIEKLKPDGRGPAIATLEKELKAVEREAETYREKRRAEIRQQFARMPNDALRAAIIEYQIRRKAGTENLRKYEQELEKAEQELAELTQTAANGSNPTVAEEEIILRSYPTLDRDKVNLREWFKVIGSNERVQVKWFEKNNSIVVSAPQSIHAQLAELLEQARAGRGVGAESGRLVVQSPPHVRAPEMNIYLPPRISEWKPPAKDADPHVFEYPASASEEVVAEGMKLLELQGFEVERDRYGEARLLAKPKHVPSRAELEALVAPFLERLPQDIANKTAIVYLGPSAKQETINRIASEIGEQGRQVNILKAEDGITLLLHWPDDAAGQSSAFTTPTPSEDSLTTTGAGNTPAILQPGDEVKIEVTGAFPEQPIDGVFVIESQGTVALGATYGRVKIAGLTLLEAEKAVTEKLKTVLTDVQVQITLIKEETPTAYLYDGKTFNEWRRLWKNELNPERRSEAIAAFAAFARAGYGKVAARAILDVAGQYDFSLIDPDAEGKLKERVLDVLTKGASSGVPVGDWMPLLMERLEQDNTKRRPLTEWLLHRLQTSNPSGIADPQTRKLLIEFASNPKFAGDPQFYARYLALALLQQPNADVPLEEDVVRLTKEVLTSDDADKALNLLRLLAFRDLVHYPEQFDLIMHDDPAVRLKVRQYLPHVPGSARGAIAERLLTMLDNPERTTDHADAVRAVGVLRRFAPTVSVRGDWERSDTYKKALDRLSRITEEGPDNLVPVAIVALGIETRERLEGLIKGWKEGSPNFSAERKERATQALDKIEAEAKKVMGEEDSSAGFMRPVGPAGEGFF